MRLLRKLQAEGLLALFCLIGFLLLPLFVEEWRLSEMAIYFTYGLFAVSLAFVWGHCGLLSLGQAVFFGVGAYSMSLVTLGKIAGFEWLVSSWVGFAAAVVVSALFANLLGRFLFSASRLQGAFFGIIMLAVAFVVERLAINWNYIGGLNGLINVPPINLGLNGGGEEVWQSIPVYYIALFALTVCIILLMLVMRSRFGLALKAMRIHEIRTRALGYDIVAIKVRAFTIGGAVAGLAGALFVTQFNFASPALIGFNLSAEVLIWAAVGGRSYFVSAALGAILVRSFESSFSSLLGDYWLLLLGGLFVIVVMYMPRGLIGEGIHYLDGKLNRGRGKP
jgi:urea ABC transporter permease protein UrtC